MSRRLPLLVRRPLSAVGAAMVLGLSMPWLAVLADQPPSPPSNGGQRTTDKQSAVNGDTQDFVFLTEARPILIRLHLLREGKSLQAEWAGFVKHVFTTLDKNGDGVLGREEMERLPPPQMIFGSGLQTAMATPTFASIDANKDGKVSLEELTAFFRRQGGALVQVASNAPQPGPTAVFMGGGVPPSADVLNDALFKLLDSEGTGKLTHAQLAGAAKSLFRLDADDDEVLTVDEIVPNVNRMDGRRAAVAKPDSRGAMDQGPIVLLRPGDPVTALTRRLQARHAGTGSKTRLTREQIGLDQATFDLLDKDKDEELDTEELNEYSRLPRDLEFVCDFSKVAGRARLTVATGARGTRSLLAEKLRVSDEGPTLDLGSARLELRVEPEAAGRAAFSQRETYRQQFRALDQDNNGYLDEKEARRNPLFASCFKLMDRDGDGMIFEKELLEFVADLEKLTARVSECTVTLRVADQGRGLFDLLDANRDGVLSLREMRAAPRLIAQFDRDGDGQLTRSELPRSQRLSLIAGPVPANVMAAPAMAFGGRNYETTIPTLNAGPLWFRKMDRNRDGDISPREFLGSEAEFRRLDTDGDGLISLEEAERADIALRRK